jgi:hypothetical protein
MRCYMTLLACGWLLLSPPLKQSTWVQVKKWLGYASPSLLDMGAPYVRWKVITSFNSAADCEAELRKWRIGMADSWARAAERSSGIDAAFVVYKNVSSFVCLPSDVVKLE